MGRRILIGVIVVLVFIGAGAAFALWTRDDDATDTASGTTTTTRAVATTPPQSSAGPATSGSTTPSTTLAPGDVPGACGAAGAAIKLSVDNGVDGARDRAQVDQCRFAAVDTSWAAVHLVAKPGATFGTMTVLLHGDGGAWAVVATGTGDAGCGQAPQQVLVDLGIVCSSSGGGGL